jgi:hypothetical protein
MVDTRTEPCHKAQKLSPTNMASSVAAPPGASCARGRPLTRRFAERAIDALPLPANARFRVVGVHNYSVHDNAVMPQRVEVHTPVPAKARPDHIRVVSCANATLGMIAGGGGTTAAAITGG